MDNLKIKYSCLNPRFVRNRYTGETFIANCGVCKACLTRLANAASYKCRLHGADYKYQMFATLTYDNENIPLLHAEPSQFDYEVATEHSQIVDTCQSYDLYDVTERFNNTTFGGQVVARCFVKPSYLKSLQDKFKYFADRIPYLSVYDSQCFLKRFRKILKKYTNEKITYYLVGEYGPVHFRPHFHVLFFFNSDQTLQAFGQALREAWKLGRIDFSLSRGKCAQYVAKYVNCNCNIPRVYSARSVRPFAHHSRNFAKSLFTSKKKEIYAATPKSFDEACSTVFGSDADVYPWRSIVSLFYPKCKKFNSSTYSELSYTYSILSTAQSAYSLKKVSDLTNAVLKDIIDFHHDSQSVYTTLNKVSSFSREYISAFICNLIFPLDNDGFPVLDFDFSKLTSKEIKSYKNRIASIFYCSNHFLKFCCDGDSHKTDMMLHKIIDYYHHRDYLNLKRQYQLQEQYAEKYIQGDISYLYSLYDNVPIEIDDAGVRYFSLNDYEVYLYDSLYHFEPYQEFVSYVNDEWSKNVKHKYLNDQNEIFV